MITLTPAGAAPLTCLRSRLQWSALGRWWLDLDTPEHDSLPTGTLVSVSVLGSAFAGAVVSGGTFDGRGAYRIVAGRGGWSNVLPRRGYQNDLGVSVGSVVNDLAEGTGEPVPLGAAELGRRGSHYTRPEQAASMTLHELAPRAWHTNAAGLVVLSAPSSSVYTGDAVERSYDPNTNVTRISVTESIAGLVPGVVFSGREPASDVEITCDADGTSVTLWHSARAVSRRTAALADIVDRLDPRRAYRASYEFRIVGQEGERLTLQPVRVSSGMGDLARVPVRPGMAGFKAVHALGSLCMVSFADADPSRPYVSAFDDADSPGWMPPEIEWSAPLMRAVTDMLTVAGGAAAVTRDDRLQAALGAIDTAILAGFNGIGSGGSASGALGATAYAGSLGAWPPATAADSLETD